MIGAVTFGSRPSFTASPFTTGESNMTTESFRAPGRYLTLAAPYDRLTSGLGAQVGSIFGVSTDTVLNTVDGVFDTEGIHEIAKVGSQAWAKGDKIYWDNGNKRCTTDSAAGILIGVATEVIGSGAGVVLGEVKLIGNATDMSEGPQAAEAALAGTLTGTVDGTLADIAATASAVVGGATPTAAQVDTGIALAVSTIVSGTNLQLKELQTKVNAVIAKLVLAGILDAP